MKTQTSKLKNAVRKVLFPMGTFLGFISLVSPANAKPTAQIRLNNRVQGNLDLRLGNFQTLSPTTAKKFFGSLYASPPNSSSDNFDAIASRLVTRLGTTSFQGDEAIRTLLSNYVLTNPSTAARNRGLTAALAGIKQRAIQEFSNTFPTANLDTLIQAAKKAGYDVEVLGTR